jgi:hypothetical protein
MSSGSYPPMQQGVSKIYCAHLWPFVGALRSCLHLAWYACLWDRVVHALRDLSQGAHDGAGHIHVSIASDSLNIFAGKLHYALEECFQYVCITRTSFPTMLCNCENSILAMFSWSPFLTRCFRYSTPLTSPATLTVAELGKSFFKFLVHFIFLLWPYLCAYGCITERTVHTCGTFFKTPRVMNWSFSIFAAWALSPQMSSRLRTSHPVQGETHACES